MRSIQPQTGPGRTPGPAAPFVQPDPYGTVTPWIATGPSVGSSSMVWSTPSGAITSIVFGAVPGSIEQIGEVPPGAQSPNWKSCGVGAKPRAWSPENPSWPCTTTANV